MRGAAAPSAHVCTRPGPSHHAIIDLRAFADNLPASPASDVDDATFWALTARAYMAELQAACSLAAQLRAGGTIPGSLGRTLLSLERMLREKIRANINDHASCNGKEAAKLLVELNAITVPAARGGA